MIKAKIKTVSRIANASALARELGVTREHLWRVATGRLESRRLAAQLRQRGEKTADRKARPGALPRVESVPPTEGETAQFFFSRRDIHGVLRAFSCL